MPKVPRSVPVTDLRREGAAVLKRVRSQRQPLIITQRGRAAVILLSVEAYEQAERERQLLLLLVRGDREIAQSKGPDVEEVLADADGMLSAEDR